MVEVAFLWLKNEFSFSLILTHVNYLNPMGEPK